MISATSGIAEDTTCHLALPSGRHSTIPMHKKYIFFQSTLRGPYLSKPEIQNCF